MPELPRLVIASVSEHDDPSAATLAIMAALHSRGYEVQHFRSLAAFSPIDYVTPLTGIASRHLDPWIMTDSLCRELFVRSATAVDFSIIEGNSSSLSAATTGECATEWSETAKTLNAPVLGVVRSQPRESFHAPPLPGGISALWIDGYPSQEHYHAEKAALETMVGLTVLGGMAAGHRAADWLSNLRVGRRVPATMVGELTENLMQVTDLEGLLDLAESRPFPSHSIELFSARTLRRPLRMAVAYDACFHCYFPDTLDALEFLGAEVCEFSPLEEERLPEGTDIVYLGCGHPQDHASELSKNECMRAALREHVGSGKRVYAEGGGTAYLCQEIRLLNGNTLPMVGVFAATAELTGKPLPRPERVELQCDRPSWIADRGQTLRGYRTGAWRIVPKPGLTTCFSSGVAEPEGIGRHHCVGSTVHLNFAAQPRVLESFFAPHAPSLCL